MISCTLEQIGDRLALVLESDTAQALNIGLGETVRLETAGEGVLRVTESWVEDPHARGRAFLRRYQRTLERMI